MIPRALLVVPVLALAAAAQPMFEGASILPGHALKGSPKSVRIEREALTGKQSRVPEEEHSFRPDGKLLSSPAAGSSKANSSTADPSRMT